MHPAWSWCSCADIYTKKCAASCNEVLSGQVCEFNGQHWHVHCLLNRLTEERTRTKMSYEEWSKYFGSRACSLMKWMREESCDDSDVLPIGQYRRAIRENMVQTAALEVMTQTPGCVRVDYVVHNGFPIYNPGKHVCGLQGFNPSLGDECPACNSNKG